MSDLVKAGEKLPAYVPDSWITKAGNLKGAAPAMAWKNGAKLIHLVDDEGNALCGARIPQREDAKTMGEQRPYLCKACRNAWEAANAEGAETAEEGEDGGDEDSAEESPQGE